MATLKRKKQRKKIKTANVVLFIITVLLILFTLRVLNIVETTGYQPSALIAAVFAAALGEFGILGWIKNTKIKNGQDNNNSFPPGGVG